MQKQIHYRHEITSHSDDSHSWAIVTDSSSRTLLMASMGLETFRSPTDMTLSAVQAPRLYQTCPAAILSSLASQSSAPTISDQTMLRFRFCSIITTVRAAHKQVQILQCMRTLRVNAEKLTWWTKPTKTKREEVTISAESHCIHSGDLSTTRAAPYYIVNTLQSHYSFAPDQNLESSSSTITMCRKRVGTIRWV